MYLVCQQPHYLPWLGYFELFRRADTFVFLDTVQWTKQGRQHRTKIFGSSPQWLTIPVQSKGHRNLSIREMKVDVQQDWAKKHWKTIEQNYRKAPFFSSQVEPTLRPFFEKVRKEEFLIDICQESLWALWDVMGIQTELHWASDLEVKSGKTEDFVDLCRRFGADTYYSSLGSTRYLDVSKFRDHGIRVQWQHFRGYYAVERPADLSVLDWLAHRELGEIRKALEPNRGFENYESTLGISI